MMLITRTEKKMLPVVTQDQTEWSVDAGYTVGEFWGLVLQSLCLPAAAVALMSFGLHSYKSSAWPSWVRLSLVSALRNVVITRRGGAYAYGWRGGTLL